MPGVPTRSVSVISPLILADDFAPQLAFDQLEALVARSLPDRPLTLCSIVPDGAAALLADLGRERMEPLMRELALLVRRNLRGTDAITLQHEEVVVVLDAPGGAAGAAIDRMLGAVRGHVFTAGASDRALRLTVSLGASVAPEQGSSIEPLLAAAREAREARVAGGGDGAVYVSCGSAPRLEIGRFVGRTEQLGRFADYLDDMVRGVGRVVAVIGESGVGTSALVRTLEPEIRLRGGSLVVGTCREHLLPSPYAVWSDVLRAVRRLPVKSTRQWRELTALEPTLEGASQHTTGGSKTQLLEELGDFLRLAAQQRPLVLLLENLQWADAASWDALEYLTAQLESERILVVLPIQTGGANDDALERWNRLASRPRHHAIPLTRLTRDDVKRWLEGAMRTGEPGRDLLAYLYRHTEGSPLLLTHLLRDLVESGNVAWTADGWQWSAVAQLPPPVSFDALINRRVDRLPANARTVLEVAAILCHECDAELLAAMSGLSPEEVHEAIARLGSTALMLPTWERETPTYFLAHDEIARVCRARLSPDRHASLHRQVAHTLAARSSASASEVAGHFEAGGDDALAHQYALLGADDAARVHETSAVAELLAAAARTAPGESALAEVRMRMATLAEIGGRYEEAEALCDQALAWYSGQGDRVRALEIKRTRVLVRTRRGQGARETLDELLALEAEARDAGADMERAALLLLMAQMHWRLGDQRAAQRVADEALTIAETGDDPVLLADACNRLAVTIQLENASRARQLFDRSLELATAMGDASRRVKGFNNKGVLELISNNWDEARRVLTIASEQARTAGLVESWGRAELNLGVLAGRIGDNEGAARALAEALRLTSMVQNSEEQLYATYNMAHLERERERYREAIDTYELCTELAERIGQVEVQAGALAGMALCHFLIGGKEAAKRSLALAMPLIDRMMDWFQGRELVAAVRLHLLMEEGRMDEATALFEAALSLAGPSDVYGAAWLTAEFGESLRPFVPAVINAAVLEYGSRPEVLGNPRIRERFTVLKIDSNVPIDRID